MDRVGGVPEVMNARKVPRAGIEPARATDFTRALYLAELPRRWMETVGVEPTIRGMQSREPNRSATSPMGLIRVHVIPPDGVEPPACGFVDRSPSWRGIGAVGVEPTTTSL